MSKEINLTKGEKAIVDDADFEEISQYKWHLNASNKGKSKYAGRYAHSEHRCIQMHRQLLNPPDGLEVDHINRNGLDNRRKNLRLVTHAQNLAGKGEHPKTYSKYKGVTRQLDSRKNPWMAQIKFNYKYVRIGGFQTEERAAVAYNKKASELFGRYAKLNVVTGGIR